MFITIYIAGCLGFVALFGMLDIVQSNLIGLKQRKEERRKASRTPQQVLNEEVKSYKRLLELQPEYEWQWSKYYSPEVVELAHTHTN